MNSNGNRYNLDLPAHLAECDANYARMMQLFPKLREGNVSAFGLTLAGRKAEVCIEVAQHSRYTTVIRLHLSPPQHWGVNPMFGVRLYHDANCAEVIEYQHGRHFKAVYAYPNAGMRQCDEKAQVNRLLGEFLSCCLRHGVAAHESVLAT